MAATNRSLGIVVATIVVIAICVSSETRSSASLAENQSTTAVIPLNPIPNSTFSQIVPLGEPVKNTSNLGTPNADLIKQDQSGVIAPSQAQPFDPQSSATSQADLQAANQPSSNVQGGNQANDYPYLVNDGYFDDAGNASDRELLDIALGTMSDSQRASFRMMWDTMSDSERQDFIAQLR